LIQIKFPARRSRLERAGAVVQLWPARGVASEQVGFLIGPANIVFYVLVGIPMARLVDNLPAEDRAGLRHHAWYQPYGRQVEPIRQAGSALGLRTCTSNAR
jgi:hypothetical protein